MMPPGIAAYGAKDDARSGVYSFEREVARLEPQMITQFKRNQGAWKYFEAQPPYYRRLTSWWVISAKKEETRARRLAPLIQFSSRQQRLPQLPPAPRSTKA